MALHIHRECVNFCRSTHGYVLLVQEKDHVRDGIIIIIVIIIDFAGPVCVISM